MGYVMDFIINKAGIKTHKGILMQRSNIDYFRGVHFHIAVLQNEAHILKMIPTLVKEGLVKQLKTMDDSIRLGNLMIITKNAVQVKGDPRIPNSSAEKCPKYVVLDKDPFSDKGIYMMIEKEDKQS